MPDSWLCLLPLVPQTYGEAVARWGSVIDCPSHEWDNRTTVENAVWLLERLRVELTGLRSRLCFSDGRKCRIDDAVKAYSDSATAEYKPDA